MREREQAVPDPGPGPVSRRRVLGLAGGATLAVAGCAGPATDAGHGSSPASPSGELAANFNEEPRGLTSAVLDDLGTKWVRGFVATTGLRSADASRQPAIEALPAFSRSGYRTVLSLKFPYQRRALPRPGSGEMDAELARVDRALDAVLNTVDILVIGNEPFLETRQEDRQARLNPFYRAVATHVIAERARRFGSGCRTRLYMGALNRLEDPARRTAAVADWLAYVRATPEIEGVDIHPHVSSIEDATAYTDYVLPRIRARQRFLATEFSLVHWWKRHLTDRVPAAYARRYGVPAATPVWRELRTAAAHPVPQRRWHDLLMESPWFATRTDYLTNQVRRFRGTGRLAVAAYGALQQPPMVHDIGPAKTPWLLNSLYANLVARPSANGEMAHNPAFFTEFRAL